MPLVLVLTLAGLAAAAAPPLHWVDARVLTVEGQAFPDVAAPYDRLPARAEGVVRDPVWGLSRDAAGIAVRFETDADRLFARWSLTKGSLQLPHMPATGVSGLDLYVRLDDGTWRWAGSGRPAGHRDNVAELVADLSPGRREYMLYLPLYNGVTSVEVGVPAGATLEPAAPRPSQGSAPIVFYGTSITQGACASRPGMSHVALLGRRLDRPVVNLGFSGNGTLDLEIADLLGEVDAAAFVIDCLPNMDAEGVRARAEPFVRRLRERRPVTPIFLVEDRTYANAFLRPKDQEAHRRRREALREAHARLTGLGDRNLYYVEGDPLLGDDGDATVDRSHPTDLGFVRMADALEEALAPVIPEVDPPTPLAPVPSLRQRAWHDLEYYAFVHFNMNTFTGREWGDGTEDPSTFLPTALDCRQWARVCRDAGMRGIILTAKHHDGFCLWPSSQTEHSVASSLWRNGEGDVVRELAEACREFGLEFGVYLSPWDRNSPLYGDSPRYNEYFKAQLREVLESYGDVFEVWFDGACGEGPNGKRQEYDWPGFIEVVRECQPDAVIFSDAGPDVRWVGNEHGFADETCWAMLRRDEFVPGDPKYRQLTSGHEDGTHWVPAECDVSIRPGWYYHESQDDQVKSLDQLLDIYYHSIGRNGSLLLNLPVDRRGLVHENDAARLMGLRRVLDATFDDDLARSAAAATSDSMRGGSERYGAGNAVDGDADTYWCPDDDVTRGTLTFELAEPRLFDRVLLGEFFPLGQRVRAFRVEARVDGRWRELAAGTTIGRKRILRTDAVRADAVRVSIDDARACPTLAELGLYLAPPRVEVVTGPRAFFGELEVELRCDVPGAEILYTLDGSPPGDGSPRYGGPIPLRESATLTAVARADGKASTEATVAPFRRYTREELHVAATPAEGTRPGLRYRYYEAELTGIGDLAPDAFAASGVAEDGVDLSVRQRDGGFAVIFDGYLDVPRDGVYRLFLTSDDGSRLEIDGEVVVDNDGLHGAVTRAGEIGLTRGVHRFRLSYFNAAGGRALELEWEGPGFERHPVPASAFRH